VRKNRAGFGDLMVVRVVVVVMTVWLWIIPLRASDVPRGG